MGWRGPMTHRQFEAWHAWLELEQNRPSRADWYAMQTALEVRWVLASSRSGADLNDMKIPLVRSRKAEGEEDEATMVEQATALSKATWQGRLMVLREDFQR